MANLGNTIVNGILRVNDTIKTNKLSVDFDGFNLTNVSDYAGLHNSIYRGKDLTNIYSIDDISAKITAGTFEDLYIGDYITKSINGTNRILRIAGFDTYMYSGDTSLTAHHIVIVPDVLGSAVMNSTNTTAGGYQGSEMYRTTLPTYLGYLQTALGSSHIKSYRQLQTNSVSYGESNSWSWVDCSLSLMSEINVYGSKVFSSSGYDIGIDNRQFPLFKLNPKMMNNNRSWYWLKGVCSASYFCLCGTIGASNSYSASISGGVRPFFLIV